MLNKWRGTKKSKEICLYLDGKMIAICHYHDGRPTLLVKKIVSSDSEWLAIFTSLVDEHQLQGCQVSVVLGRMFYQNFDIEKPKGGHAELLASLPFSIKDLVSENIFDLVVDYYDMPLQQRKGEQITVICTPKTRIISIRDMVLNLGLTIKSITTEELALTALLGIHEEVNLLLSQQGNELVLTVVKQGQLYFSHRLRGFNEFLPLPIEEVESALVDGLSLELQRAFDYISSQFRLNSIGSLYLALSCNNIELLSEKLSNYLDRKVQPFGEKEQYDFLSILTYGGLLQQGDL